MKKKTISIVILLMFVLLPAFCAEESTWKTSPYSTVNRQDLVTQLKLGNVNPSIPEQSAVLAVSNSSYMVTPGDIYSLSYYDLNLTSSAETVIHVSIQVDADSNVFVPVLGRINAEGMTYIQLRDLICSGISETRPYSNPQMAFVSCGVFQVFVCGEVNCASNVQTWRLARLSDFCNLATKYASSRNVSIIYPNGSEKTYDLYEALTYGLEDQNPYICPGCTIRFNKADSVVKIQGCVCKPGEYQIVQGQTIGDLIRSYANGFDYNALSEYVTVEGVRDGVFMSQFVTKDEFDTFELHDMDCVSVASVNAAGPYVTVQGAVDESRIIYEFYSGETANQLIRSIQSRFLKNSDLDGIYLLRNNEKISIDCQKALSSDELGSVYLQQGDVLVVPYSHQYITVSGGVLNPGNYDYQPDKPASYYVDLAGGFTTDARRGTLGVTDSNGIKLNIEDVVPSNSVVSVKRRNTNAASGISLGISIITFGLTLFSAFK